MKRLFPTLLILMLLLALVPSIQAQGGELPEPERVTVDASDGLALVGDFYLPALADDANVPAVLLLHMMDNTISSWNYTGMVDGLYNAGYAVLVVDQRGGGETGGEADWVLAVEDVQTWIDWLREQPGVDPERINLVGGSIGGMMALYGMMNDEEVAATVALSPAVEYDTLNAVTAVDEIRRRPLYLVAAQADGAFTRGVREMAAVVDGDAVIQFYKGSGHGTGLFFTHPDLAPAIIRWLDLQNKDE
ncbi:MAG TPA: alpha/beta fold hydrolase [Aggregatilineaceae bacterium]|nr:alpha/beta fold hydrolase [Aggregatilineaceae bacterium]